MAVVVFFPFFKEAPKTSPLFLWLLQGFISVNPGVVGGWVLSCLFKP